LLNHEEEVKLITDTAVEEKAIDVLVMKVSDLTIIADYFIIASGRNSLHLRSIADAIIGKLKEREIDILRIDGYEDGKWLVIDLGAIIVHIFHEQEREYYQLEQLWGDAPRVILNGGE